MITEEQYNEAKRIIEQYEQQLNIPVVSNNAVAVCWRCGAEVPDHPKYRHTFCKECGGYGTAEPAK
jgi:rRNA maturation endonuclease Nob1